MAGFTRREFIQAGAGVLAGAITGADARARQSYGN